MKTVNSIAMILVTAILVIAAVAAIGEEFKVPRVGTFTGGSTSVTNTGGEVGLGAVFLSGTSSNFYIQVVNITGYTNTIAPSTATAELAYMPSLALPWRKGGVLILTTGSTNTASYTIYPIELR